MLRGQINESVPVLLSLISFYFDRLKSFCKSKPDRDFKKWQKAIVVLYLDATMIVDSPKSMWLKTIQVSLGENHTYDFGAGRIQTEGHGLDQQASQKEFQGERMYYVCSPPSEEIILN